MKGYKQILNMYLNGTIIPINKQTHLAKNNNIEIRNITIKSVTP